MPVVIPLHDCIARPSKSGRPDLFLVDHLIVVARGCGDPEGALHSRIAFLGGLSHDAAKAAPDWQCYIRGGSQKGPPHAATGAALFAFWAEDLISCWTQDRREQKQLHDLALDWVRIIHRHHGALDDLAIHPPWEDSCTRLEHEPANVLAACDKAGLDLLVRKHFPETRVTVENFENWSNDFGRRWGHSQGTGRTAQCNQRKRDGDIDRLGLRMAELGALLIYADRLHAAEWEPDCATPSQACSSLLHFEAHCLKEAEQARNKGVSEALLEARQRLQSEALASYQSHDEPRVVTLLMPTGYGKTLAGLRIALEAVRTGACRRIVYVAPYISILSQAAGVLQKATGMRVVLHHQMSILSLAETGLRQARESSDDLQCEDHQPYDLLDTWQAPIVATTFNQLFRALFPARAQECLRIPALDRAFVFIDEPQIIDAAVWSAFLRAIAVVSCQRRTQVLFCTATLPPLDEGLGGWTPAMPLVRTFRPDVSRFLIRSNPELWNAARVAHEARCRRESRGSVAVILNTVRDAVEVYRHLKQSSNHWFFIASRMLPGHKERIIGQLRKLLDQTSGTVGVVCTQVLEAGVDLSFRSILRARPIFPSIVQAAGRANRHGEGALAEVVVFTYHRDDEKDSRCFVYKDKDAVRLTDLILAESPEMAEADVARWLEYYYSRCWEANPHLTSLQRFDAAARGKWTELGGQEPFQEDFSGVDVFVPGAERFLPRRYGSLLKSFGAETAMQLLGRYLDRDARREFSHKKRRILSALIRQFLVDFPKTRASEFAHPAGDAGGEWPLVLDNPKLYSRSTGLAHLLVEESQNSGTCVA
jgi:CRISPR-associated endonuclease/helicase Cas3